MTTLLEWAIADSSSLASFELDPDGTVLHAGPGAVRLLQFDPVGRPFAELCAAHERERIEGWRDGALDITLVDALENMHGCTARRFGNVVVAEGDVAEVATLHTELVELAHELSVLERDHQRRARELEAALKELRETHWHLRRIQEVLPLCMNCRKVKGDGSSWQDVVEYLFDNDVFVSHGLCPGCAEHELAKLGS